jgi:peptidoglycan/LPS O-acetylase OafA/YrhL
MERVSANLDPRKTPSSYVPTLDGWRAVAILGVLICHGVTSAFRPAGQYPNGKLAALAALGSIGVPIFFGISGFLITSRFIDELARAGRISLRDFYIRRAWRILPASLSYLLTIFVLQCAGLLHVEPRSWLASLFFFKNLVPDHTWYLSHFWSLSLEEQFYLLWPLMLVVGAIKRGLVVAISLALIAIIFREVFMTEPIPVDGLFAGCAFAFLKAVPRTKLLCERWLGLPAWLLILGIVCGGMVHKIPFAGWWMSSLLAALVAGTVMRPLTWVGRVLEHPVLRWVGRMSYSLYLWQELFCLMTFDSRPFGVLQEFPLNIAASFCIAVPSFYFIEKPLIRIGRRLAPSRAPALSHDRHAPDDGAARRLF